MSKIQQKLKSFVTNGIIPAFKDIQWLEIPVQTYVRWILAILVSVNTILTFCGVNPISISENNLYEVVTVVLNVIVLVMNTYKNNSTSSEALITDQVMRLLKSYGDDSTKKKEGIAKLNQILEYLNGDEYISDDSSSEESNYEDDNNDQ